MSNEKPVAGVLSSIAHGVLGGVVSTAALWGFLADLAAKTVIGVIVSLVSATAVHFYKRRLERK